MKSKLKLYIPFTKKDEDERMVWGYCSTDTVDSDGEVITKGAIRGAWDDYMKWANIREMHQLSAVGKTKEYIHDEKGTWIGAKVVDDNAWKKVKEEVYIGFSIGGGIISKIGDRVEEIILNEISLVDRPANEGAKFELVKREGGKLVDSQIKKVGSAQEEENLTKDNMKEEIKEIKGDEEVVENTSKVEKKKRKKEDIIEELDVEEETEEEESTDKEEEVKEEEETEEEEEKEEEEEEEEKEEETKEEEDEGTEKADKVESLRKLFKEEVDKTFKDSLTKVEEIEKEVSSLREEVEELKKVKNTPKTSYTIEKNFEGDDGSPNKVTYKDLVKEVTDVTEKINKVHERAKTLMGTENFSEEMKVNEELTKLKAEFLEKKRALENFGRA